MPMLDFVKQWYHRALATASLLFTWLKQWFRPRRITAAEDLTEYQQGEEVTAVEVETTRQAEEASTDRLTAIEVDVNVLFILVGELRKKIKELSESIK